MTKPAAVPTFRYFSPVEGRVMPRYGSQTYIGASRSKDGFVINTEAVVAIPDSEILRFPKEYRNALSRGDLKERTKEEHDAFVRARAEKSKANGEALKKQRIDEAKEATKVTQIESQASEQPAKPTKSTKADKPASE